MSPPNSSSGFPTANESGRYRKCCSNQRGDLSDQLEKCLFSWMWRQCRNGNAQCTNRPQIFTYWRKVPAKLILTTLPILSIMRVCEECGAYCHVSPHRLGTTSKITLSDSAPRKFQKKKNTSNLKTFDTLKWWHPQLIFNSGDLIQRAHFFQKNGFPVPTKIWIWLETSTINRG